MCIHFDNRNEAIRHLVKNGWRNFVTRTDDYWLSKDGTCKAGIKPIPGSSVVMVHAWEI